MVGDIDHPGRGVITFHVKSLMQLLIHALVSVDLS